MTTTLSEDVVIFNGLTPSITDMKVVYKALQEFFDLKKSLDPSDRYNFILFEEDGPNYLEDFTLNPGKVLTALRSLKPKIVPANIAGGIFAALTLIIDVFKRVYDKCFRLIILMDSGSLKIPPPYINILQDLIDKVHTFPVFIDVIRFKIDDSQEDEKIMNLAKSCKCYFHAINSLDSLSEVLEVLAIKREITSDSMALKGYLEIPKENQPFLENIAENLIPIDQEEMCSICSKKGDINMVQCPSCLSLVHKKCYALWAKKTQIGIPYIFRCHQCYYLLKLDKEFVLTTQMGSETLEKKAKVKTVGFQKFLEDYELILKPEVKHIQDPLGVVVLKSETMPIPQKVKVQEKPNVVEARHNNLKVFICPNCGRVVTSTYKECPNCHFPLE